MTRRRNLKILRFLNVIHEQKSLLIFIIFTFYILNLKFYFARVIWDHCSGFFPMHFPVQVRWIGGFLPMTVSKFRLVWKISDLSNKDLHKKYATYFSLFHKVLCIRGMLSFIFQNINFVGNGGIGVGDGVMWELTKHCLRHLKVLRSAFASESISMSNGGVL